MKIAFGNAMPQQDRALAIQNFNRAQALVSRKLSSIESYYGPNGVYRDDLRQLKTETLVNLAKASTIGQPGIGMNLLA